MEHYKYFIFRPFCGTCGLPLSESSRSFRQLESLGLLMILRIIIKISSMIMIEIISTKIDT
jgi:hypothetical protein